MEQLIQHDHGHGVSNELRLHAILLRSRANGPGIRTVIWFQGCTLNCPGCFNPLTHGPEPRLSVRVDALLQQIIRDQSQIEGLTLTGGEPFQQRAGLLELVAGVRAETRLSILVFSGYTLRELMAFELGPAVLQNVDVLIAGRYVETMKAGRALIGSANQQAHFLTPRYRLADLERIPLTEVHLSKDGTVRITGIKPLALPLF